MKSVSVIKGQQVDPLKLERAKELRRKMTRAEKVLWGYLRGNKLGGVHFRRQQIIAGFIVDFYCDSAKLIVELDGKIHEHRAEEDAERDKILKSMGLQILRIKNEEVVNDLPIVLAKISSLCSPKL